RKGRDMSPLLAHPEQAGLNALRPGSLYCYGMILYMDAQYGNDSNLLIVFYVQIMPDDLVMQLHRF
ncbi:hypothetical protein JTM66_34695, partial [Pseudomonas aeruginosa]|nr:hypothetical protein [Pseudomonas aeruginosa]